MRLRAVEEADAAAIAPLLGELGYPSDAAAVLRRLQRLAARPEQWLCLAERDGKVLGLCHAQGVPLLASDGYAEVMALVVHADARRQGVARQLLAAAWQWAQDAGYPRLRLRSGVQRQAAHACYRRLGFTQQRASYAFELM